MISLISRLVGSSSMLMFGVEKKMLAFLLGGKFGCGFFSQNPVRNRKSNGNLLLTF